MPTFDLLGEVFWDDSKHYDSSHHMTSSSAGFSPEGDLEDPAECGEAGEGELELCCPNCGLEFTPASDRPLSQEKLALLRE